MTAETISSNFYFPPSRINFVSKLQVLLQQQKLVVIEGPTGVGKTVVIEELLTTALPDANKCYITASKSISDIQVRSRVIEQLFGNVLFDPEKPLISSFLEFNQQTQLMLAIDNAHFLSGQIIGELLQVFSELNKAGIQLAIVLSFDKTISTTLLNINSSILSINAIPLLSKQESYLLLAEYVSDLPGEANIRVKRWIENSGGIPIQLLAYDQDSSLKISDVSGLDVKFWGIVVIVASVVLAVGLYLYRLDIAQTDNAESSVIGADEQVVSHWQSKAENVVEFPAINKPAATVIATPTASPEDILNSLLAGQEEELAANLEDNLNDTKELSELSEAKPESSLIEDGNVQAIVNTDSQLLTPAEESGDDNNRKEESVQSEKRSESELIDDASLVEVEDKNDGANGNFPAVIATSPTDDLIVTGETEQYPSIQTETFYKIDNQAFLSLPADHYVLQLTAVSSEATLAQYLLSAPVNLDLIRIYKIKRNQSDWIVVTYGLFTTIEQARIEAQRVEPNAWAKSVAVIQQQVTQFNQSQLR